MRAIACLTVRPHPEQVEFYARFGQFGYDVFFIIDDEKFRGIAPAGINFTIVKKGLCLAEGFRNICPVVDGCKTRSKCAAWEKALYFFCRVRTGYDSVWFFEDDTFIPSIETLMNIDKKYDGDIISAENDLEGDWVSNLKFWASMIPKNLVPPPWARSMVCCVRLSRKMLTVFNNFIVCNAADISRGHYYHLWGEYIFHTLALKNGLVVTVARELRGLTLRHEWALQEMDIETIFHPIKNIASHRLLRNALKARHA